MGFSFKAMWNYKCPRCHIGDIFTKPFQISKPVEMPERCEACGQKTSPEPGFYFGAMFLSYIFSGFYILLPLLALIFYFKMPLTQAMLIMGAVCAVSYLKILRVSRSLYFHLVVRHNQKIEDDIRSKMN